VQPKKKKGSSEWVHSKDPKDGHVRVSFDPFNRGAERVVYKVGLKKAKKKGKKEPPWRILVGKEPIYKDDHQMKPFAYHHNFLKVQVKSCRETWPSNSAI